MSNLGLYQWFTTTAKKVGGPLKLLSLIFFGGYAVIRSVEAGAKHCYKLVKKNKSKNKKYPVYEVIKPAIIEDGVEVQNGDKIVIRAIDKDVAMIEILENENNPYFVDINFLKSIINYK